MWIYNSYLVSQQIQNKTAVKVDYVYTLLILYRCTITKLEICRFGSNPIPSLTFCSAPSSNWSLYEILQAPGVALPGSSWHLLCIPAGVARVQLIQCEILSLTPRQTPPAHFQDEGAGRWGRIKLGLGEMILCSTLYKVYTARCFFAPDFVKSYQGILFTRLVGYFSATCNSSRVFRGLLFDVGVAKLFYPPSCLVDYVLGELNHC